MVTFYSLLTSAKRLLLISIASRATVFFPIQLSSTSLSSTLFRDLLGEERVEQKPDQPFLWLNAGSVTGQRTGTPAVLSDRRRPVRRIAGRYKRKFDRTAAKRSDALSHSCLGLTMLAVDLE